MKGITWKHVAWDLIVFAAVIVSIASVSIEVLYDLDEGETIILLFIDAVALGIFAVDLWFLWQHYTGPFKDFIFSNWLDFLSAIPVFRIIRVARFARLLKMARLRRLGKLKRVKEVKEKVGSTGSTPG